MLLKTSSIVLALGHWVYLGYGLAHDEGASTRRNEAISDVQRGQACRARSADGYVRVRCLSIIGVLPDQHSQRRASDRVILIVSMTCFWVSTAEINLDSRAVATISFPHGVAYIQPPKQTTPTRGCCKHNSQTYIELDVKNGPTYTKKNSKDRGIAQRDH